jgi:hypothetical protein
MERKELYIESASLVDARSKATAACAQGWVVVLEEIVQNPKKDSVQGLGVTAVAAEEKARAKLPKGATITGKSISEPAQSRVLEVEAYTEDMARNTAKSQITKREQIEAVRVAVPGRSGFLGVGKKKAKYELRLRSLAVVELSYTVNAKLHVTIAQYDSLAGTLQRYVGAPIPDDWTTFRSKQALFEVWYPAAWTVDIKQHLILRPSFAESDWTAYSPAMTLIVGTGGEQDQEKLLSTFGKTLSKNFSKFRLLSEERVEHRGLQGACYRFLFEKDSSTWEAAMLCLIEFGKIFVFDASGKVDHVAKHREELEAVIASLRVFPDAPAFEAAAPNKFQRPIQDLCPESNVLGVLFSITTIDSACYGEVVQDEFFRVVDAKQMAGTRISVGDILPECEFFCVKLETPKPSTAQYVRRVFGESCPVKELAPIKHRFMSGNALEKQRLPAAGSITFSGLYEGRDWY